MVVYAPERQVARATRRRIHSSAFAPMMYTALATSLVVLVVSVAVAATFGPPDAVAGAAAGVLLVTQFFAFGAIGLRLLMSGPSSGMLFGALAIYAIQVTALLYALMLIPQGAIPAPQWFALSAAVETVAWQAAQSVALLRARVPLYAPDGVGER